MNVDETRDAAASVPAEKAHMLTLADVDALTGDDIAYWLNNPFMAPDLLAEKVRWWVATAISAAKADALRPVAADLYRNHDMPPRKDGRSYSYRNGWWDGVHHAARVVERAASDVSKPPTQTPSGGSA